MQRFHDLAVKRCIPKSKVAKRLNAGQARARVGAQNIYRVVLGISRGSNELQLRRRGGK